MRMIKSQNRKAPSSAVGIVNSFVVGDQEVDRIRESVTDSFFEDRNCTFPVGWIVEVESLQSALVIPRAICIDASISPNLQRKCGGLLGACYSSKRDCVIAIAASATRQATEVRRVDALEVPSMLKRLRIIVDAIPQRKIDDGELGAAARHEARTIPRYRRYASIAS